MSSALNMFSDFKSMSDSGEALTKTAEMAFQQKSVQSMLLKIMELVRILTTRAIAISKDFFPHVLA